MAVVLPIIMAASGASAAIAGAATVALGTTISATMVTALSAVAFTVTGISEKVNEAAADVFGEDLVQVANIFGAAYGAFSGGTFGMDGAASGIDAATTAGDYVNAADAASDAFTLAGDTGMASASNAGGFSLAEMAGGGTGVADQAEAIRSMGGDADEFLSATKFTPDPINGNNLMKGGEPNAPLNQPVAQHPAQQPAQQGAASQQATAPQQLQNRGAADIKGQEAPKAPKAPRSFFDKFMFDEKGNVSGTALRVGGGMLAGYAKSASDQKMLDQRIAEENRRMNQRPTVRQTR